MEVKHKKNDFKIRRKIDKKCNRVEDGEVRVVGVHMRTRGGSERQY